MTATEKERIWRGVAMLPDSDRRLLELSFREGLLPTEIALRTGEPPERIRKRKSRALERLREIFRTGHAGETETTDEGSEEG